MIDNQDIPVRLTVLQTAKEFVEPILEKYPLEEVINRPNNAPMFTAGAAFTETTAAQAIDHMLHVADWILKEHNE